MVGRSLQYGTMLFDYYHCPSQMLAGDKAVAAVDYTHHVLQLHLEKIKSHMSGHAFAIINLMTVSIGLKRLSVLFFGE